MKVVARNASIEVLVTPEVRELIRKAAILDNRTMSSWAALLLERAARERLGEKT